MRIFLLLLILCFTLPISVSADIIPDNGQTEDDEQAKENFPPEEMMFHPAELSKEDQAALAGVIDSLDIGKEKKSWRIRFKESEKPSSKNRMRLFPDFPDIREWLGKILRFAAGVTLAAAVIASAVYAYRNRSRLFPGLDKKSRAEREPIMEEPWLLLEEAEKHNKAGKIRQAWALCFRAFTAFYAICFYLPDDATEYEALALARKNCGNTEGFALFIRHWVHFAYGGVEPKAGLFEEALASCRALLTAGGEA